ncbi:hypothetical protein EMWEY_00016190 [Eimeria maxima]|uniref:Uncharacterized protein n=1 Tax=Eimeria maxima TaxID=5804 RepID=U6LWD4_EIMMA|nr:hypothetical protein EMWEY_00016190 [Eimeria maxima]CDJ56272.1 hypothetical protein EMWEY_00016190 [Eimeria maxima]
MADSLSESPHPNSPKGPEHISPRVKLQRPSPSYSQVKSSGVRQRLSNKRAGAAVAPSEGSGPTAEEGRAGAAAPRQPYLSSSAPSLAAAAPGAIAATAEVQAATGSPGASPVLATSRSHHNLSSAAEFVGVAPRGPISYLSPPGRLQLSHEELEATAATAAAAAAAAAAVLERQRQSAAGNAAAAALNDGEQNAMPNAEAASRWPLWVVISGVILLLVSMWGVCFFSRGAVERTSSSCPTTASAASAADPSAAAPVATAASNSRRGSTASFSDSSSRSFRLFDSQLYVQQNSQPTAFRVPAAAARCSSSSSSRSSISAFRPTSKFLPPPQTIETDAKT